MEIKELSREIRISPPWYTYANKIKYTHGCSPYICVENLKEVDGGYELKIKVSNDIVAKNLREILPETESFGNIVVFIKIYNSTGQEVFQTKNIYKTVEEVADLFCNALKCNPFFGGIVILEEGPDLIGGSFVVIIDNCVVQFYNDDISNICRNYTEVAAKVFREITILNYPIEFNVDFVSYDEDCKMLKNKYICK